VTFRANIQTAVRWAIANRKAVKLTSPKRAVDIVKEEISYCLRCMEIKRGD